jgi:hypothetical protein
VAVVEQTKFAQALEAQVVEALDQLVQQVPQVQLILEAEVEHMVILQQMLQEVQAVQEL